MVERIRSRLSRAAVRPNSILPLDKFIESFTEFREAPRSLIHLLGDHDLEERLASKGYALRETRLRSARPAAAGPIVVEGFGAFTPGEQAFIENLSTRTQVTVVERVVHAAPQTVFSASTLDREVEQIVSSILDYHREGRKFSEVGILVRSRDPYVPALKVALTRFSIPLTVHSADPLVWHPAIQYITGIVRSFLAGWDHAALVAFLRMPVNGLGATPEGDRIDFAMRENLPAVGLPALEKFLAPDPIASFAAIDAWKHDRLSPADWAARIKTLYSLIPSQAPHLQLARSNSAAFAAFDQALNMAALALDDARLTLAAFWPSAEAAIMAETFRPPDRRRDVVNVVEIQDAPQWDFAIAFVPGLIDRHFSRVEDRVLFNLATTAATGNTILSYPRFNDKGDPILRSAFLAEEGLQKNERILPKPVTLSQPLLSEALPDLRTRHATLSPTSIESFLQCPFQFFAGKTLRLRQRPPKPQDRLDILLQGSILHQAIAEGAFDTAFEQACYKSNIPRGYRTEAVRLELLRNFEAFQADAQWTLSWPARVEEKFSLILSPEFSISGRIDRLLVGPDGEAIVIDYKYSPAAKIRERLKVQGGIYLLAAERLFHLRPVGMFYCALREPITWDGFHAGIPGLALGEWTTLSGFRERMEEAGQQAIDTFHSIVSGHKEVQPADPLKCRYCDYKTICRVEAIPRAVAPADILAADS